MTERRRMFMVTDPTCEVVVFFRPDGSAQAVATAKKHSMVGEIPAPPKGERIAVKRLPDGCVEVVYEESK